MAHIRDITIEELSKHKYIGISNYVGDLADFNNVNHILISSEEQSYVIVLMINYTNREKAEVAIFKNSASYANYVYALYQKDKNEKLGYVYSFLVDKNKIAMVE